MGCSSGPETIAHSTRIILLLFSVSIPPVTGNFIIPCVVDGTACIFRNPGLPMTPLCGDVDLTTMKSIHADVECSSSPIFTKSVIYPNGHFISQLNRGLLSLHCLANVGTTFPDWVRSFELSFVLLPFIATESLEFPEVSLFRRFHLSFSAGLFHCFASVPELCATTSPL
ncbi:hypothetical protein Tco_1534589 [Tanacetum coccineum]